MLNHTLRLSIALAKVEFKSRKVYWSDTRYEKNNHQ